jgi:formylglycine-generating enzyme required for sulfatase activity
VKKSNPWLLYDMLGNVENWVEDCYAPNYDKTPTDGSPNLTDPCPKRVVRGGSWYDNPRLVRAARRNSDGTPDTRNAFIGFRVARTVTP